MKVRELANRAVDNQDPRAAKVLVEYLRLHHGFRYADVLAFVQHKRPHVTAADWDALLYEADQLDTGDRS